MAAILTELDPAGHELTSHFTSVLAEDDWDFAVGIMRAELRTVLEMGLAARAVATLGRSEEMADEAGIEHLLGDCGELWEIGNFGTPFEDGRAERWTDICSSTQPVVDDEGQANTSALAVAAFALRDLAHQKMFDTLDEEFGEMLSHIE